MLCLEIFADLTSEGPNFFSCSEVELIAPGPTTEVTVVFLAICFWNVSMLASIAGVVTAPLFATTIRLYGVAQPRSPAAAITRVTSSNAIRALAWVGKLS